MLLARRGYRVRAVDRATFPSDTLSTHVFTGDSIGRIYQWGLLERVLATGCFQARHAYLSSRGSTVDVFPEASPFPGIAPRRTVLDRLLVDAAREAGAEVSEGVTVRGLVREGERVTGVHVHDANGHDEVLQARIVIGADGRHSPVAAAVGAEKYHTVPPVQFAYYSYWRGFEHIEAMELRFEEGGFQFAFPTNDDLVCIGATGMLPIPETARHDPETFVRERIAADPVMGPRAKNMERAGRMMGWSGYASYFRMPSGPGWALVGDAGCLKDPTLGQGIHDAFRDADYLSQALDDGFSGRRELSEALADYRRRRDTELLPGYQLNDLCSRGNPPVEVLQVIRQANADRVAAAMAQQVA
jgi:flavin-dependent dehydrogenase